jgi:hypothetical protein
MIIMKKIIIVISLLLMLINLVNAESLADLKVNEIATSSSLFAGGNIYLSAEVENIGDVATSTTQKIEATWYVDGNEIFSEETTSYIVPGGLKPRFFAWWYDASAGQHEVEFVIEAPGLDEESTSNNDKTEAFNIVQSTKINIDEVYFLEVSDNEYELFAKVVAEDLDEVTIQYKLRELGSGSHIYDKLGGSDPSLSGRWGGDDEFEYDSDQEAFLIQTLQKNEINQNSKVELIFRYNGESDTYNANLLDVKKIIGCRDSDGGKEYFVKGNVVSGVNDRWDTCLDEYGKPNTLEELFCPTKRGIASEHYNCPYGCQNGACIEFVDSEEEIDVPEEETESSVDCPAKSCRTISKDCYGEDEIIIEECKVFIQKDNQCEEISISKSRINKNACEVEESEEIVECEGCQLNQNTCIPFGTRIEKNNDGYYCSIEHKMLQQKNDGVTCQNTYECVSNNCKGGVCSPICSGCLDDKNVCIPFGTRTETQYCDIDFNFKNHKSEEMSCNNNYECSTNVCVNSNCVSPNLIQKIILWFQKLFG